MAKFNKATSQIRLHEFLSDSQPGSDPTEPPQPVHRAQRNTLAFAMFLPVYYVDAERKSLAMD